MRKAGAEVVDPVELPHIDDIRGPEYEVLLYEFKADLEAYFASRPGAAVRTLRDLIAFNAENADREMPFFGQEILEQAAGKGPLTERAYLDVVIGKTASLFGWCAAAGAWAAGVDGRVPEALSRFGEGVGIAFQLVDDALDYGADPGLLGKRLGQDLLEGKATLPLIRAVEAEPSLRERLSLLVEGKRGCLSLMFLYPV